MVATGFIIDADTPLFSDDLHGNGGCAEIILFFKHLPEKHLIILNQKARNGDVHAGSHLRTAHHFQLDVRSLRRGAIVLNSKAKYIPVHARKTLNVKPV